MVGIFVGESGHEIEYGRGGVAAGVAQCHAFLTLAGDNVVVGDYGKAYRVVASVVVVDIVTEILEEFAAGEAVLVFLDIAVECGVYCKGGVFREDVGHVVAPYAPVVVETVELKFFVFFVGERGEVDVAVFKRRSLHMVFRCLCPLAAVYYQCNDRRAEYCVIFFHFEIVFLGLLRSECHMQGNVETENVAVEVSEPFPHHQLGIVIGVPVAGYAEREIIGEQEHSVESYHCVGFGDA